jgi:hypothetical protein
MLTQEKNRAHALGSSQALPPLVLRERERHQRYLEHRMKQLRREARRLIARDSELELPVSADADGPRDWRN